MALRFRYLLPLAFLLVIASCDTREDDGAVSIVPRSNEVGADGGSLWVSVTAPSTWIIDLEYPDGGDWAVMDPASGEGSRGDVRLRYDANPGTDPRRVTMILRTAGGSAVKATVTQLGPEAVGVNGYDTAPWGWLELPATREGDGLTFYAHNADGGKYVSLRQDGTRNWSMYWSDSEHMSLWVAYPLNKSLIGNGSRSNAWGFDPLVPLALQPDLIGGSYGGGWTRGHQLPSADRLSYRQNVTTFYSTNMTPQQYDFNGGIWAGLEGKVRSYAGSADTLYVVTGCMWEGSSQRTGMSSGFAVRIPTHYFKALLFRGRSTYAPDGYMAAGYLLPHDRSISGGNFLDYIMSVDELESQTGIDFFPNLADLLGKDKADALEAQTPSKWWK